MIDGPTTDDLHLAQRVATRLALVPGQTVIEAPCGDGRFTLALAESLPPGVRILGVDPSASLIDLARRHTTELPRRIADAIAWRKASPQTLPLASGAFGGACTQLGRVKTDDVSSIITELARTVLPGGWVVGVSTHDTTLTLREVFVRCNLRDVVVDDGLVAGRKRL